MLRAALALIMFAAAGGAAWLIAPRLAALAEARYTAQVDATLAAGGVGWATGQVDGLRVALTGAAPSDAAGAEAMAMISAISPVLTVTNATTTGPTITPVIIPPELEILKGADGLILTGVIADEAMAAALDGDATVLTFGAAPFAPDWAASAPLLRAIAANLRHARISVSSDAITVRGLAETPQSRETLQPALEGLTALGWRVETAIDAPPPALTDFGLTATQTPDGASTLTCAAASPADAARIETAAKEHLGVAASCKIGAGAPDANWADASITALTALAPLKAAELEMTGKIIRMTITPPTAATAAATAQNALAAQLPAGYQLILNDQTEDSAGAAPLAPFHLSVNWSGDRALTISSAQTGDGLEKAKPTLAAYARALFPGVEATFDAAPGAEPPAGWRRATRSGLDALSDLQSGALLVEDGALTLTGAAARVADIRRAHDALAAAGEDWRITTRITFAPAAIAAAQPQPPAQCATLVAEAIADAPLSFQPGSTTLTSSGMTTIDRIAAILARCEDARFEIGGHTDAQGAEAGNLALSRNRAEAVLSALIAAKAPAGRLVAKGYGEAQPVATNATVAGRALNRRIEFKLIEDPE